MDKKYMTYCGLYCGNCAVKVKVEPLALALYEEMKKAGFEEIVHYMPGGDGFWPFLKEMAMGGVCTSCREGRGNPGCAVRICALEKSVETCAFCSEYPCEIFTRYFEGYPILRHDNALLRDEGLEAWAQLQDERQAQGLPILRRNRLICSDEKDGVNQEKYDANSWEMAYAAIVLPACMPIVLKAV